MIYKAKPNGKLCRSCIYFKRQNDNWGCCDYISMTGRSRAFKNRERLFGIGECDKYEKKEDNK